jgi:hypothetical protein
MYIADRASTLSSKRLSENGNAVRGGVMSASPKFESLSRAVLTYHERFRAEHPRFRQTSARKWRNCPNVLTSAFTKGLACGGFPAANCKR